MHGKQQTQSDPRQPIDDVIALFGEAPWFDLSDQVADAAEALLRMDEVLGDPWIELWERELEGPFRGDEFGLTVEDVAALDEAHLLGYVARTARLAIGDQEDARP